VDSVLQQLKPESFSNGFRCCGIYPFDKYAVNYNKHCKNKIDNQTSEEPVSKEMLRIHLKILQTRIGADKIREFENNNFENGDACLNRLWKKVKEDYDLEAKNRSPIEELGANTEDMNNDFEERSIQEMEDQIRSTNRTPIGQSKTICPARSKWPLGGKHCPVFHLFTLNRTVWSEFF
jgi:hypothetical protein